MSLKSMLAIVATPPPERFRRAVALWRSISLLWLGAKLSYRKGHATGSTARINRRDNSSSFVRALAVAPIRCLLTFSPFDLRESAPGAAEGPG
jgi:hypothetical protein